MAGLSKENPLKNVFNEKVISDFANKIKEIYPDFKLTHFLSEILNQIESLGFIERSNHIRDTLKKYLPDDYVSSVNILVSTLGEDLPEPGKAAWESFIVMPLCSFVSKYGKDYFDVSMNALYEMTKRFTAEGDLKTFIESDYEKTMKLLHKWCNDSSPHVRRLVSEGTRPRLPLSSRIKRFQKDPRPVIELLDKLKNDKELYVRRSVANNINDIAKDNPEIAIETLKRWHSLKQKNTEWVVKHAARSLIKQGNSDILDLLGFSSEINVNVEKLIIEKRKLKIGEPLIFSFSITSNDKHEEMLVVDYVIHYVKANGKTNDKVFKLREIKIKSGEQKIIEKKHILKNTSGRKHYSGIHHLEIQVNGKRVQKEHFEIIF